MPTSNKLATLPLIFIDPLVGDVVLLNIFSKVLLPAPFSDLLSLLHRLAELQNSHPVNSKHNHLLL